MTGCELEREGELAEPPGGMLLAEDSGMIGCELERETENLLNHQGAYHHWVQKSICTYRLVELLGDVVRATRYNPDQTGRNPPQISAGKDLLFL